MSFFFVTIETIDKLLPIAGADFIVQASLKGLDFSFVTKKDAFKEGDSVLYFPVDSLIPETIQGTLGVAGKLAGASKTRVKTIKLKNVYSQGVVGPLSMLDGMTEEKTPENITKFLGVTKYEPEAILEKGANLNRLPNGLSKYDIEGTDRNKNIIEYMMDKLVKISEKIEGQNTAFHYNKENKKFYVCQRNHSIDPIEGSVHTWWKFAIENNLEQITKTLSERFDADVSLYGEGCGPGIQENIYKFPTHRVLFFDLKIGNTFADTDIFDSVINEFNLPTTPDIVKNVTLSSWLSDKSIPEMADGKSMLSDCNREGIVIRLMKEENIDRYGRSIIKKRGPIYLSKTDN